MSIESVENQDTTRTNIEAGGNLRGKGQTKDSSKERRLSGPYSKKNGLKKARILNIGSKDTI